MACLKIQHGIFVSFLTFLCFLSRPWLVCTMKLHVVFQLHQTVCRLILCPVQLSPKFPAGCFSPKPTLSVSSSKPSLAPLPRLPLLVIPPRTHTGCLYHNTHTGTPCHHPHSGCPFKKNLPLFPPFDPRIFGPKFQDGSTPVDLTRCLCEKKKQKFKVLQI